jgi:hypothetical protein
MALDLANGPMLRPIQPVQIVDLIAGQHAQDSCYPAETVSIRARCCLQHSIARPDPILTAGNQLLASVFAPPLLLTGRLAANTLAWLILRRLEALLTNIEVAGHCAKGNSKYMTSAPERASRSPFR